MSKFGIRALTDTLRLELAPAGIGVVLIEPGAVATPIWRRGKDASAELLARAPAAAAALYSDQIRKVTQGADRAARTGLDPSRVADVILTALASARPRPRYLVGIDAKAAGAITYLPDRIRYPLLARQLG